MQIVKPVVKPNARINDKEAVGLIQQITRTWLALCIKANKLEGERNERLGQIPADAA